MGETSNTPITGRAEGPQNKAIIFVMLVVFLDMIGVGLVLPVTPALIELLSGLPNSAAAEIGGWLLFTYAIMQFFAAPILGGLSDRFGRRPVILLALTGLAFDYLLMAFAPGLMLLFVGRFLSGIMGATWPTANAFVADISESKDRAKYFGLMGAAGAAGLVFGPALGGVLGSFGVAQFGPEGIRLPFFVAAGLTLLAVPFGFFVLQESLKPEQRRKFEIKRANPLGSLLKIARTRTVVGLLLAWFLLQFAWQSFGTIWPYYTIEMFDWSELEIGLSTAFYAILSAGMQGGLVGPLVARFGEVRLVKLIMAQGIVSYVLYVFVPVGAGWLVYPLIIFGTIATLIGPCLQSIASQQVDESQQGELQGAIASVMSLTLIGGPVFMAQIFAAFTREGTAVYLPGAPFVAAAILVVFSLTAFSWATRGLVLASGDGDQT
ncbi:MAG: TCR/Tet family MFS transporter [Hyphomonadaceae bacterium]